MVLRKGSRGIMKVGADKTAFGKARILAMRIESHKKKRRHEAARIGIRLQTPQSLG
jgi:hypothetical protein